MEKLITERVVGIEDLPWEKIFNTLSDGPNGNKKLHQLLDNSLKEKSHPGLLPFFPCTLHTVHNAFQKLISTFPNNIPQFCFDLHAWFKNSPCKSEDYAAMAEETGTAD